MQAQFSGARLAHERSQLVGKINGYPTRVELLNPRYVRAHHWYLLFLAAMGRHDEAIEEIRKAQKLDPLALIVSVAEGRILHFASRFDDAIAQFQTFSSLMQSLSRRTVISEPHTVRKD
jgi:tetratricopeptide (TPR) repeat protein